MLAVALLAMMGGHTTIAPHRAEADWWERFVAEMKAIGCRNLRRNEQGEWEYDCPSEKLAEARAIVARYAVE